jgi:hypothetical protein
LSSLVTGVCVCPFRIPFFIFGWVWWDCFQVGKNTCEGGNYWRNLGVSLIAILSVLQSLLWWCQRKGYWGGLGWGTLLHWMIFPTAWCKKL